ncbi:MAG TPA: beta-ketoacyl-ACP synthase III [Cytophagales bacterium]|nr:beta-ketoacyl-ACP synthase III [Cytophagales bacterium]
MHIAQPFNIAGVGTAVPECLVTSEELEQTLGLPKGWSEKYSGVRTRYHAEHETNSQLAAQALRQALDRAGLQPKDLNVVISAAATYDYPLPNNSCMIMHELAPEVEGITCLDVDTTCLSFLTGIDYAARLLASGDAQRVAVVSSEIASRGLNPDHKESATRFGDGAAAFILERDPRGQHGLVRQRMQTYPAAAGYTMIRGGGNAKPFRDYPYDPVMHSFHMEGKILLKYGKRILTTFIPEFFADLPLKYDDVDWVLPHQASKTALYLYYKLFPVPEERKLSNLETRGNCIAASLPTLLAEAIQSGNILPGQTCFLVGTAAGLSIGGLLWKI